jgi:hypothetical protein
MRFVIVVFVFVMLRSKKKVDYRKLERITYLVVYAVKLSLKLSHAIDQR